MASRLAKSKHTSQEDIIAILLRHNEVGIFITMSKSLQALCACYRQ